jgi:2',3'-cyclic-nucleotide 2'-phosphodiesterase
MRILFIGDLFGRPGRELLPKAVAFLRERYTVDLVIANVENAAGGFGITREVGGAIRRCGVDVMTSGNHIWDRKEATAYVAAEPRLLRPANYPAGVPGRGSCVVPTANGGTVGVVNLMGRVFMLPIEDPFAAALREIEVLKTQARIIIVDFHGEATSEKMAMGWHLDGRVTAVIGTHTHVQTADEQILPGGTAYITDCGMTGPHDSIIGTKKEAALSRFLTGLPTRLEPASGNPRLHAVVITADEASGRAVAINRLSLSVDQIGEPALLAADRSDPNLSATP